MKTGITLTLNKFDDLGGKYFEQLVAIALDELGYVEGQTYIGAWAEKCVPGTWIEADFIISEKADASNDPLNNGRVVLAIGHATSENSAGMKFHRDVEQLMEVKALMNGSSYRVMDILFCCPRESMGGWSKELVAINEAIFDNSLTIWNHDWGVRLLQQIQLHGENLTQGNSLEKKKRLTNLLSKQPAFKRQFNIFKNHLQIMLDDKTSHSMISDIFNEERKQLPLRLAIPLQISKTETSDFKRGLLQVLALNPWEVELLQENHAVNQGGSVYPLEMLALDKGMDLDKFNNWWKRLDLLTPKLGMCSAHFIGDEVLLAESKEWRFFNAGKELSYIFDRFTKDSLKQVIKSIPRVAPNLLPYITDLHDLSRVRYVCGILNTTPNSKFLDLCVDCYLSDPWKGLVMPRLLVFEVAKAAVKMIDKAYSYDVMSNESGNQKLIKYPGFFRGIHPGKRGKPTTSEFIDGCKSLQKRLSRISKGTFNTKSDDIIRKFIYERLDGMVKQPKGSVLDALLEAEINNFAKKISASVASASVQGIPSAFNTLIGKGSVGVNVEVPYVLTFNKNKRILIHRVSASDGNAGHKWKEFSSKIRSIRYSYDKKKGFFKVPSLFASILIVDGNWTRDFTDDPFSLIRALQVAGWDYVVYPDQLTQAFSQIEMDLLKTVKKSANG